MTGPQCDNGTCQSCCGAERTLHPISPGNNPPWLTGWLNTPAGRTPQVATKLSWADLAGAARIRLTIGRMRYAIEPGLYAVGSPTPDSPVLVSANYKLSFDHLRRELTGIDAWIVVLDTMGINVWCAAGKGTFGTAELVSRIEATGLADVVSHRRLIVPQLGAPGVAAHEVKKQSGFRVVYGPVRAKDIPAFLEAGMQATPEMRRVRFDLVDRLVVVPVELVMGWRYAIIAALCLFLLAGLGRNGYDRALAASDGLRAAVLVLASFVGGGALTPMLLPWLPGRAFATKGAIVGLLMAACAAGLGLMPAESLGGKMELAAWVRLMPPIAAFFAMNFTGASTYTSLSGVKKEMRLAVPAQIAAGLIGLGLWMAGRFV